MIRHIKYMVLLLVSLPVLASLASAAVPFHITYIDTAGYGFNDAALGAQRKHAFEYAVNIWATQLNGTQTIEVNAHFQALGGDSTSAQLANCGPRSVFTDFNNTPRANTWFVSSQADQLANANLKTAGDPDMVATFNSDLGNPNIIGGRTWYYGTDGNPPNGNIDMVTTILHEMGHGLGFLTLVDGSTGAWYDTTPDIFGAQLNQPGVGNFINMSNSLRKTAQVSNNLFWIGSHVMNEKGGPVKMFAPNPYMGGSSVSHWDTSNDPDLLMEPYDTGPHHTIDLTRQAFQDMGWSVVPQQMEEKDFTIYNDGDAALAINDIALDSPAEWITWQPSTSFVVPIGGSKTVKVFVDYNFAPSTLTKRRLVIQSNDPYNNPFPDGVDITVEAHPTAVTPTDWMLY